MGTCANVSLRLPLFIQSQRLLIAWGSLYCRKRWVLQEPAVFLGFFFGGCFNPRLKQLLSLETLFNPAAQRLTTDVYGPILASWSLQSFMSVFLNAGTVFLNDCYNHAECRARSIHLRPRGLCQNKAAVDRHNWFIFQSLIVTGLIKHKQQKKVAGVLCYIWGKENKWAYWLWMCFLEFPFDRVFSSPVNLINLASFLVMSVWLSVS